MPRVLALVLRLVLLTEKANISYVEARVLVVLVLQTKKANTSYVDGASVMVPLLQKSKMNANARSANISYVEEQVPAPYYEEQVPAPVDGGNKMRRE